MWKVKVEITLTDDDYTKEGKEIQVQIEETIPDGFQNLDQWESNVHQLGFRSMRELFKQGIELFEERILSEYTHQDGNCQTERRGFREFALRAVFGKVTFPRQRIYCKTCGEWVIPLNEALGLHDDEQERATPCGSIGDWEEYWGRDARKQLRCNMSKRSTYLTASGVGDAVK